MLRGVEQQPPQQVIPEQQPPQQVIPEKSTFREGTRRDSALTSYGADLASIGFETKYPLLKTMGIGVGLSGMIRNYNNSEEAIRVTEDKINTLKALQETPESKPIIEASNNFINNHREDLLRSMGFNIVGGALIGKGITDRSWKYIAVGAVLVRYGSNILYSSLEMADENIDNANAYIQRNNPALIV